MNNFDLIGALRSYATTNSWAFLYGQSFMRNYEASKKTYTVGKLILGADPFIATPKYTPANKIESITYSGLLMLGRKFETTTSSDLDETMIQKYDNRLFALMGTLSTHLTKFACAQGLRIMRSEFELSINALDENIDFVVCSVTFLQE